MRYLLDTHVIIWLANESIEKISDEAMGIIRNPKNKLHLSVVSLWEITLKVNNGKLDLGVALETLFANVSKSGIAIIPIKNEYLLKLTSLQPIHKDPFDRLMVATAICENMPLLSGDEIIKKYDVLRAW